VAQVSGPVDRSRKIVSELAGRFVYDNGVRFEKVFLDAKEHAEELDHLRRLEAAGVAVPEILSTENQTIVTRRMEARCLDEIIAAEWSTMPREPKNALIAEVAELCARVRDGGYDWPDLVTYHIFVGDGPLRVIDPARLRRGKLELSPLYWSCEEPTVTRSDRLRFWKAYAGEAAIPRLRRIGHRGRFRPYRWVHQKGAVRELPNWDKFVKAVDAPFTSADEVRDHPDLDVWRTQLDRINATLGDWFVKITTDPDDAKREWDGHQVLLGSGFRAPRPVIGGVLSDGRGLFSTIDLRGLHPMDNVWETLDPNVAMRAVADVARRLHVGGLVHKDLYLCHFFIARGGETVTLIDLARLTKTRSRRLRIKDLAAIVHSAKDLATRTQLMRGFRRYGGNRRLLRSVLRKERRMARHVPRNMRDGTHQPFPGESA
jgi:tRNA A-37 threonylcarbamoyl transferase component Bud32